MKRIIAIALLIVLALSIVSCKKTDAPDGMKNASAENAKFYLYVPDSWYEQTEINSAVSPLRDGANVNATTYLADTAYTPVTYWETKALPEINLAFKDALLVEAECGETELGGLKAMRYVYDATLGGVSYRFMQIIAVDSNMVYTLTYTAKPEHYATHLEDVESIRAAFAFK